MVYNTRASEYTMVSRSYNVKKRTLTHLSSFTENMLTVQPRNYLALIHNTEFSFEFALLCIYKNLIYLSTA